MTDSTIFPSEASLVAISGSTGGPKTIAAVTTERTIEGPQLDPTFLESMEYHVGDKMFFLLYLGDLRFKELNLSDILFEYDFINEIFFIPSNPDIQLTLKEVDSNQDYKLYHREKISDDADLEENNWNIGLEYTKKYTLDAYYTKYKQRVLAQQKANEILEKEAEKATPIK